MKRYYYPPDELEKILFYNDWSLEEFCKRANVTKEDIFKIYNQDPNITLEVLFRIAEAGNIKLFQLVSPFPYEL